jgi:hypothetical protein
MLSRFHTVHCVAARFCLSAVALLARTENLRFGLWLRRDFIGGGNGAAGFIEEESAPALVILPPRFLGESHGAAAVGVSAAAVVVDRQRHGGTGRESN